MMRISMLPVNVPALEAFFREVDLHAETHFSLSDAINFKIKALLPTVVNLARKMQDLQEFEHILGGGHCEAEWRLAVEELVAKVFSETDGAQSR